MTQPIPITSARKKISLANVKRGVERAPYRLVIWGTAGVGKTTWAAESPSPIFLCTEQGADQVGVDRWAIETFQDYIDAVSELLTGDHSYRTVVVDSLAPLEAMLHRHLCELNRWKDIDAPAYGKGFSEAVSWWRTMLESLDGLRKQRRMNVIFIGHSTNKNWKNPEGEDFDRYEPKLHTKAWELIKAWADGVLFARHEVLTSTKDKRTRGVSSGARVLCTQWRPSYDAKVRWLMPETIPLSWDEFLANIEQGYSAAAVARMRSQVREIGSKLVGTEHEGKADKGLEWSGDDPVRLAQTVERLRALAGLAGVATEEETASGKKEIEQ